MGGMKTKWGVTAALAVCLACAEGVYASDIDVVGGALIRANSLLIPDMTGVTTFNGAVQAAVPMGMVPTFTPLGSLVTGEGLIGGAPAGTLAFGSSVAAPAGITFSAASGSPALNSGLPGSTALYVDKVGSPGGTNNLYYLGPIAEGAVDSNRVQFTATGATTVPQTLLRPVSFDTGGQAIQTSGGEKGGLSAGKFKLSFASSLNVHGIKVVFTDTEINAAPSTGLSNIVLNGNLTGDVFGVPAGGNGNDYFLGFYSHLPLTSVEISLGWINSTMTGGDAVLMDFAKIELIQVVPEPGTFLLVAVGAALGVVRRRRSR